MNIVSASIDRRGADIQRGIAAFGVACRQAIHEHRLYLAIILIYTIAVYATGMLAGLSEFVNVRFYAGTFTILIASFSTMFVIGHAIWMAVFVRPSESLFAAIGRDLANRILTKQRIAGFLAACALAPLFFTTFGSFKRMIPQINPFHWDPAFMRRGARPGGYEQTDRLLEAARRLEVPTLLVRGRESDVVSEEGAAEFLAAVPHARFVDVSKAGHMVAGDQNDAFTDAVARFLSSLAPR